jgi:hypothetical protein
LFPKRCKTGGIVSSTDPKNPPTATGAAASKTPAEAGLTPNATAEETEAPKKKTSRRWRDVQRSERRLTKAQKRMAKAVLAGIERWDLDREKSARKKRDGAMKDAISNALKAYSKMMRESANVPRDLAKGMLDLYPKSVRKMFRI